MIDRVRLYIEKNNLLMEKDSVILGISGGADSVCLLYVMKELSRDMRLELTAVHIDHSLRGEEAREDCDFVQALCRELEVDFQGFTFDVAELAKINRISLEEAGRNIRYETFHKVLLQKKACKIAVAHNKNDNAETILLNLFRGSGIKGMTGIRPFREKIIRPLLCVSRGEIEKFLDSRSIAYRTDRTNFEDIHSRNKIRLNILPEIIQGINSQAVNHIINAGEQLCEIEEYLEEETGKAYERLSAKSSSGLELDCIGFGRLNIVLKKQIIRKAMIETAKSSKDISSIHIKDVLKLFDKQPGKRISLPYGMTAMRTYDSVILQDGEECEKKTEKYCIKIMQEGKYTLPGNSGIINISIKNRLNLEENHKELYTKCLDYDKIKGDLFLRTRLEGDYFIIDSSEHKKKLKSFFIDSKIPKKERDMIPLLAQGSHILWIAGYRISEACRVTKNTTRVLKVGFDGGHDEQN